MGNLVRDVMSHEPASCREDDPATEPARLMWERDCGAVPVIDEHDRVVAMITDRDLCMAAYTRGLPLSAMRVREIVGGSVVSVAQDDTIDRARAEMARAEVRRLPVIDGDGTLRGVISINDVLRAGACRPDVVVDTLVAIGMPRTPDLGMAD